MSVTINVISIDGLVIRIEAIDNKNNTVVMRSLVKIKQRTKKSIDSAINDQFKAFKQPVWGGFNICYYIEV